MHQLLLAIAFSLPIVLSPLAGSAQTETQPQSPQGAEADDPAADAATYRLLTVIAGTIGTASLAALLADGWIVELMTLEGLSTAQASSVVANLENEGGLEAAVVLLSAVLGGIGGQQLGWWLFPDPPSATSTPATERKMQPAAWSISGLRAHVPF